MDVAEIMLLRSRLALLKVSTRDELRGIFEKEDDIDTATDLMVSVFLYWMEKHISDVDFI